MAKIQPIDLTDRDYVSSSHIDICRPRCLSPLYFNEVVAPRLEEMNGTVCMTTETLATIVRNAFAAGIDCQFYAERVQNRIAEDKGIGEASLSVNVQVVADDVAENRKLLNSSRSLPPSKNFCDWVYCELNRQMRAGVAGVGLKWDTIDIAELNAEFRRNRGK